MIKINKNKNGLNELRYYFSTKMPIICIYFRNLSLLINQCIIYLFVRFQCSQKESLRTTGKRRKPPSMSRKALRILSIEMVSHRICHITRKHSTITPFHFLFSVRKV